MTNDKTHQVIFLYPDLVTALLGTIDQDTCQATGHLLSCQVSSLGFELGILKPGLINCDRILPVGKSMLNACFQKLPTYLLNYVPGISDTVINHFDICDPYESNMVEVRTSTIPEAGQGLFARKNVAEGTVVAFFAGVEVTSGESFSSEYSISWLNGSVLDIPQRLRSSYCCTLGHKACHSFAPNCEYCWAHHPRFGKIRSLVSLRPLETGEEILTDYKYSYSKAPAWYRDDLHNFLENQYNMSKTDIAEYVDKMEASRSCR